MKKLILFFIGTLISVPALAQIDYATEIAPILANNCNSCHSGGGNGFDSSPYADLIASSSTNYNSNHIIPGDADSSPLVDKIEASPQFGSRMPQGGQLTTEEINKIKQWINEGAGETATSNEDVVQAPEKFRLLGNYPNPFNPSTTIQFEMPVSSRFQISVYNANGQLVSSVEGTATAGVWNEQVNLSAQPTGVYFYRVRAFTGLSRQLVGSGKMTLVK